VILISFGSTILRAYFCSTALVKLPHCVYCSGAGDEEDEE
jgi:hypothetical protein